MVGGKRHLPNVVTVRRGRTGQSTGATWCRLVPPPSVPGDGVVVVRSEWECLEQSGVWREGQAKTCLDWGREEVGLVRPVTRMGE